jgi:hypothetical protein
MSDYGGSPSSEDPWQDRSRAERWRREAGQRFTAMGLDEDLGLRTYTCNDYAAVILTSTRTQGWVEVLPDAETGVRFGRFPDDPQPTTPAQALGVTNAQMKALRTRILGEVMYPSLRAVRRADREFPGPPVPGYEHISFEDGSAGWFDVATELSKRLHEAWETEIADRFGASVLSKDYELSSVSYSGPQSADVELVSRANGSAATFYLDGTIRASSALRGPGTAQVLGIGGPELEHLHTRLLNEVMVPTRDVVAAEKHRTDHWDPLDHGQAVTTSQATDLYGLLLGPHHREGTGLGELPAETRQPTHPAPPPGPLEPHSTPTWSAGDESGLSRSTRLTRAAALPTGGPSPMTRSGPGR